MTELSSDYVSGLGLASYAGVDDSAAAPSDELGQEEFLNLMITQLTNQDPTNPTDNQDFIAQMAQFSTLTGIQELTSAFEDLSETLAQGQTLQAAALVGEDVLAPADSAQLLEGQGLSGAVDLTASTGQVTVGIYDQGGALVKSLELGTLSAGLQEFVWDGLREDGSSAPAGTYAVRVTGQVEGATQALDALLSGQVRSVSLDGSAGGLTLSVQGIGSIGFSDVYRIGSSPADAA